MLVRVSPRNAASTFGASIEQALQGVEVRVKRLEDQPGHAALEEALRSAEARLQRLERERDGQAKLYERVEALVNARVGELRQSVNRSLEVIVDKVRGEVEGCRDELLGRDAQTRKDLAAELEGLRELRRWADGLEEFEIGVQAEVKATKDVCMAATLQLGAVEDSVGQLRVAVAALPSFLWGLGLGEPPYRRPDLGEPDDRLQRGLGAQGRRLLSTGASTAQAPEAAAAARPLLGAIAASSRRRSPESASTEPPSPRRREGVGEQAKRHGSLARASLATIAAAAAAEEDEEDVGRVARADGEASHVRGSSSEATRRKKSERQNNREALAMASIAGESFMDAASDRRWAATTVGERGAPGGTRRRPSSMARAANEVLLDFAQDDDY